MRLHRKQPAGSRLETNEAFLSEPTAARDIAQPRQQKEMVAPAEASATKLLKVLFIRDYFRRRLARFKLGTHLLDLSCLLFKLRRENLHPFLLLRDR